MKKIGGDINWSDQAPASKSRYSVTFGYQEKAELDAQAAVVTPDAGVCRYPQDPPGAGQTHNPTFIKRLAETSVRVGEDSKFSAELPDALEGKVAISVTGPSGRVLAFQSIPATESSEAISIKVTAETPPMLPKREDNAALRQIKLYGRVVDIDGKAQISNRQVIISAVLKNASAVPIIVTKTDATGSFSADYPFQEYDSAHTTVSGAAGIDGKAEIPLQLETGSTPGLKAGMFPRRLLIAVKLPTPPAGGHEEPRRGKDECDCNAPKVPRVPDGIDLTQSPDVYSEDLGGKCVGFTIPNRTLEEFSFYVLVRTTAPQIRGTHPGGGPRVPGALLDLVRAASPTVTAARRTQPIARQVDSRILARAIRGTNSFDEGTVAVAEAETRMNYSLQQLDALTKSVAGRADITASTPIDWDDTPTFYQATTVAHGHVLHLKQIWRADGYSLGDLLYSLPLAPCQKKQIAIFDWQRAEVGARTEDTRATEELSNVLMRDRDIIEVVGTALREHMKGESSALTMGFGQGGGASGSAGGGGVGGGAVMGHAFGGGYAQSEAEQNSSRDLTANALQQLRDRTMQATSVVRSQRSTVIQTVTQAEGGRFQTDVVHNHNHCHAVTIEYFEVLRHFQVTQELESVQECLFIPLEMNPFDYAKVLRWEDILRPSLRDTSVAAGFTSIEKLAAPTLAAEEIDWPLSTFAEEEVEDIEGQFSIRFEFWRRGLRIPPASGKSPGQLVHDLINDVKVAVGTADPEAPTPESAALDSALQEQTRQDVTIVATKGRQFADSFVNGITVEVVTPTGTVKLPIDATLVSGFSNGVPLLARIAIGTRGFMSLSNVTFPRIKRADILAVRILPPAFTGFQVQFESGDVKATYDINVIVDAARFTYRTQHLQHALFDAPALGNDLGPGDYIEMPTPLDSEERRNLRMEEERKARRLLRHINDNIELYHRIIWSNMNPDRRFMLLDGFFAPGSGGRSIASVVENRVLGIVGNSLVMPVAPGINLDPAFLKDGASLLERYAPDSRMPAMRLSLPTQGVFAEAVMGSCNSCETKDETRFWRFEESPCGDEPTAIVPLNTDSRRADPGSLVAKDLPQPIVNIQNAPLAPDPTGLAAALGVIGKPELFRDLTGLDQNQKNALAAYVQSLEAAKHFGSEASKLAQTGMQQNNGGLDKSIAGIQKAKDQNLITDQQASDLAMGALRHMVGQSGSADSKLIDSPQVKTLLDSAASSNDSRVSLSTPEEGVEVQKGGISVSSQASQAVAGYSQYLTPELAIAVRKRLQNAHDAIPLGTAGVDISGNDEVGKLLVIEFDVDKDSVIDAKRIQALNVIAEVLNSNPAAKAYVIGRASQTGTEAHNLPLSERRARAVTNWLTDVANVPSAVIKDTFGIGTLEPLIDRRGIEDPLNRSVEVLYSVPMAAPPNQQEPKVAPQGSTKWAIHFEAGVSGGLLVQAGIFLVRLFDLSDQQNPVQKVGYWTGIGLGLGLELGGEIAKISNVLDKLPSVDLESAVPFETSIPLTFADFNDSLGLMVGAGGGLFVASYAISGFAFKKITTTPWLLSIGGFSMPGPLGVNAGTMNGKLTLKL